MTFLELLYMFFVSLKKNCESQFTVFDPVFLSCVSKTGMFPYKYKTFFKTVTVW